MGNIFQGLFFLLPAVCFAAPSLTFTDITLDAGITHRHEFAPKDTFNFLRWFAGGAVAEDFDGDGWIDLYVVQGHATPNLLYMNNRDGTFTDEAASREADITTFGMGACAADYDNDGDIDICVTTLTPPHPLLINDGTGHFTVDRTTLTEPRTNATSPSWGDLNNDGLLELAVGRWNDDFDILWVYQNRGNGVMEPHPIGNNTSTIAWAFSPRFADFNGDRHSDLAVVADFRNSQIYLGDGTGSLENVTVTAGTGAETNGMGNAICDIDNDGDLDWFVTSIWETEVFSHFDIGNRLYLNRGDATFEDITNFTGLRDGNWGWGIAMGDLDLDADIDIFHVNGWVNETPVLGEVFNDQPARLFQNEGSLSFVDVAAQAGADNRGQGRGTLMADFDNDGDLDLFIVNNQDLVASGEQWITGPGTPALLRNDTITSNHWLKVSLEGTPPLHHNGIGSRVYVTANGVTQMHELNASTGFMAHGPERIAHFGLRASDVAQEVRAEWVDGSVTVMENVSTEQWITLRSPSITVTEDVVWSGEVITASGASAEPLDAPREWVIDGQVHDDPVTLPLDSDTPATVELRLNLFQPDGITPLRSEILRVQVRGVFPSGVLAN